MDFDRIYSTKDYSKFKLLSDINRDTVSQKVLESIRKNNLLPDFPIVISPDFYVLDGQHRLVAAQILELEIYYKISKKLTSLDIPQCQTRIDWMLSDYVKFYHKLPVYNFVKTMFETYKIPYHCIVSCCSSGNNIYKNFREGLFKVKKDINEVELSFKQTSEIVDFLKHMVKMLNKKDVYFNNRLFRSIFHCTSLKNYDHGHMMSALQTYPKYAMELLNINSQALIIESLRNGIYNRRLAEKNKI